MITGIDPKSDPTRRCKKIAEWPEQDRMAWQSALGKGDRFEGGGLAADWGERTQRKVAVAYGRWLTWGELTGRLDPTLSPAQRVTREAVGAYMTYLQTVNAPYTVLGRVRDLGHAMRAMAPDQDWSWLRARARRLRKTVLSVRNKPALIVPIDQLFAYGLELMTTADGPSGGSPFRRAMNYRDGLLIAILAARQPRRGNLAAIEIDRHLIEFSDRYWLRFKEEETKTRARIEKHLPAMLVPHLERYLSHYRPYLVGIKGRRPRQRQYKDPAKSLWVSTHGSAMSEQAIYYRVKELTKIKFGRALSPHLARDAAASSIAIEDPEHVQIIPAVLGHTTMATAEGHYIHAQMIEASGRYQNRILELRQEARDVRKRASRTLEP